MKSNGAYIQFNDSIQYNDKNISGSGILPMNTKPGCSLDNDTE